MSSPASRIARPVCVALLLGFIALFAGAKRPAASPPAEPPKPAIASVELFDAVETGQLDVRFIPKNARQARILIENKTDQPLNVRLPEAFAALPVLAQFQPGGNIFGGGNNNLGLGQGQGQRQGNAGGNQAVGGGANQGQNGGNMNGLFNVPPGKIGQVKVACVCLEHGKPEPRAAIPYRMVPLDDFTTDPAVRSLLEGFARDDYDRPAAQAAVWHLANSMSWDELAAKRIRPLAGPHRPYFTAAQLDQAKELVKQSVAATTDPSPGIASASSSRH